jgi:hypothetical protein
MKKLDYIKLLVSTLLQAKEPMFQTFVDFISNVFDIKEPYKVNVVSLAGIAPDDQFMSLFDWAKALSAEHVLTVSAFLGSFFDTALETLAAPYSGQDDIILNVKTSKGNYYYIVSTEYSPAYGITPVQFALLVNEQKDPKAQWERLEEVVQESNELGIRARIEEDSLPTYLISPEGKDTFHLHCENFIAELQMTAIIHHQEFVIPETLTALFLQSNYSFDFEEKDYAYLYTIDYISAAELKLLISSQPSPNELWARLTLHMQDYSTEELPNYTTAKEWEDNLLGLSADSVNILSNVACRSICEYCDDNGLKPTIPESLKKKLGPSKEEALRIQARSKLQRSQWILAPNNEPWELNVLQPIDYTLPLPPAISTSELKKLFQQALIPIREFAHQKDSYFVEAFDLAIYLLSDHVPSGSFDEPHKERIIEDLKNAPTPFSEQAIQNFSSVYYYSQGMLQMDWEPHRIYGLLAVNLADVFGGMGSWNDVYYELEADNIKHGDVSSNLYSALRNYFVSIISSPSTT